MQFIAIIHLDAGSSYGVSFPDLPGCFSAADDAEDIQRNAIEALDLYFDDVDEVPAPRGIDVIRAEVADDLAAGAYLMSIPHIPRDTVKERRNINMDRGLWKAIDAAAERLTNKNVSAFLTLAARNEIEGKHQ